MVNDDLLNALRYKSEGTDLDFKREQYRFAGGSDHEKSEMLKDILAIANAWRDGTGYILLGFKDNRPHLAEVVGIAENIDDAHLQQFVNSKVKPKLTFRYEEHVYEGHTVGVIAIPKQKRTFFLEHPYGKLKAKIVYVRRGSSTEEADPLEVGAMVLADSGRAEVDLDLRVLTPENVALPDEVELRYMRFPKQLPDYETPPTKRGPFEMPSPSFWHDNSDFLRELSRYVTIDEAKIEFKLVLTNRSQATVSNAKVQVSVEPLDGQLVEMLDAADLPAKPKARWNSIAESPGLPKFFDRRAERFYVDVSGGASVCHSRFGSLLPGETGTSDRTLVLVPSAPGRMLLRLCILAGELAVPQQIERVVEATGEIVNVSPEQLTPQPLA